MTIYIHRNKGDILEPTITGGIEWTTAREGSAGRLAFNALAEDERADLGDTVAFYHEGAGVFVGRIFSISGSDGNEIKYTAYDQLFYLKNEDTYVYSEKTLTELLIYIAEILKMPMGDLVDTEHKLTRVEEDISYWDMILNAVDDTAVGNGEFYVLYDDFGKIRLKNNMDMRVPFLLDKDTCFNFSYGSDITDAYNSVELYYDNQATGQRDIYRAEDSENIAKWGVLNYYDDAVEPDIEGEKAQMILSLLNRPKRTFSAEAMGDIRMRAGAIFPVYMQVGDILLNKYFIVDEVSHKFEGKNHKMNLKIVGGGGFIA